MPRAKQLPLVAKVLVELLRCFAIVPGIDYRDATVRKVALVTRDKIEPSLLTRDSSGIPLESCIIMLHHSLIAFGEFVVRNCQVVQSSPTSLCLRNRFFERFLEPLRCRLRPEPNRSAA